MKKFRFGVNMGELVRIVTLVDLFMQHYNTWTTDVPIIPGKKSSL